MNTVTVYKTGQRFRLEFSQLPGKSFGPWGFAETVRDLTISALLEPLKARDLVMDAFSKGSATSAMG
jgi:hypothetical protein